LWFEIVRCEIWNEKKFSMKYKVEYWYVEVDGTHFYKFKLPEVQINFLVTDRNGSLVECPTLVLVVAGSVYGRVAPDT